MVNSESSTLRRFLISASLLVLVLPVVGSGCGKPQSRPPEAAAPAPGPAQVERHGAAEVAREACDGVGAVGLTSEAGSLAPVVVLAESHVSIAGQIEEAIALVRLHDRYDLRDIALEGYTKEEPKIDTSWFAGAAGGLGVAGRARVATQLLGEGEISSAEFLVLPYDDIIVHATETQAEYQVELPEGPGGDPGLCLVQIAQRSLTDQDIKEAERLLIELEGLDGEAREKKAKEVSDLIFSRDEWAKGKAELLRDPDAISALSCEDLVALMDEIEQKAAGKGVALEPSGKKALADFRASFASRVKATATMVGVTRGIAARPDVPVAALVVGAAHTDGVCQGLLGADCPHAVVRPASLDSGEDSGELTDAMYARKLDGLSVYSDGLSATIESMLQPSVEPGGKKYPIVVSKPWFQVKAEAYVLTERIVTSILGPPPPVPPPGGGKPPWGFGGDELRGKWIHIDPALISEVPDKKDGSGRAVLFPATITSKSGSPAELWVKAGLSGAAVRAEQSDVEAMLQDMLRKVKTAEAKERSKAEDAQGRLLVTANTVAAFGKTERTVRSAILERYRG